MHQPFVVRMLAEDNALLGWVRVFATSAPQPGRASCPFWPVGATKFQIEQDGIATKLSIEWPELGVARLAAFPEPTPVRAGQTAEYTWMEPIWLVSGMRDVPVPPVTERAPVRIGVPEAQMGARGHV